MTQEQNTTVEINDRLDRLIVLAAALQEQLTQQHEYIDKLLRRMDKQESALRGVRSVAYAARGEE